MWDNIPIKKEKAFAFQFQYKPIIVTMGDIFDDKKEPTITIEEFIKEMENEK